MKKADRDCNLKMFLSMGCRQKKNQRISWTVCYIIQIYSGRLYSRMPKGSSRISWLLPAYSHLLSTPYSAIQPNPTTHSKFPALVPGPLCLKQFSFPDLTVWNMVSSDSFLVNSYFRTRLRFQPFLINLSLSPNLDMELLLALIIASNYCHGSTQTF